jgi:superfamily II DNA or RNA helicase
MSGMPDRIAFRNLRTGALMGQWTDFGFDGGGLLVARPGIASGRPRDGALPPLAFQGRWRRYQDLALEAFERDRRAGRHSTHVLAPPGSGKTMLGMEIVRRLGMRALVLCPNSAVQAQWLRTAHLFGASDGIAAADPSAPIACLTYQSLCQIQDPDTALGNAAERRWIADRARAVGDPPAEVERDAATWRGAAAKRRSREIARIKAAIKREIARGAPEGVELADLLELTARRRVETLRQLGVGTLVLDECHHLASLWGYVVRAVADLVGDVHLVGLTATPPDELTEQEAELYQSLLGPVDFTIPTPAVVREGFLAPYQELAWLTEPLESEADWLAEHNLRFRQLITDLHYNDIDNSLSFPEWVVMRLRARGTGEGEPEVPWTSFQRRHPTLARAGLRFLAAAGLVLPEGAPRGEGYREPPTLDDWLVLLEDYALRCLSPDPSPAAAERYQAIAAALSDLGFRLTRQGIRRAASDVDLLLANSAAKTLALADVLACELDARLEQLRALVLCDAEVVRKPGAALVGVLRPEAGTAPEVVRALAADERTAIVRPLLVSGRGLRCAPNDADQLLAALEEAAAASGERLTGWRTEADGEGLVRLIAATPAWQPASWALLATRILTAGATRALIGTRALLGEGWDAPCVNCLIDLTTATTGVSVRQMRGRSLRLDPNDAGKIASNWDVVCVAPDLSEGSGDYDRFVRKHLKLYAPSEDGRIEAGPTHVHPALGPFAPPPAEQFAALNRAAAARARNYQLARARWRIGTPYRGEERDTLLVRHRAQPPKVTPAPAERPPRYPYKQSGPLTLGVAGAASGAMLTAVSGRPAAALAAILLPVALAWVAARLGRVRAQLADALPLDRAAHAVLDAYKDLGEMSADAASSLAIEPRASGYLRCLLRDGTEEESARFTKALDDLLVAPEAPRYLVSRLLPGPAGRGRLLLRLLTRRTLFPMGWEAVPGDLGRRKDRAEAFARAWRRWLGPGDLIFTHRTQAGHTALAQAGAQSTDYETSVRNVWV